MKYLLFIALLPVLSFASEGDAFTAQLYKYEEMGPSLSLEVNNRLSAALDKANKSNHGCNPEVALKAIKKELLRPVVGVFEYWSSHTDKVKGHYVDYANSIYRDLGWKENFPIHLGKFGMATFFKINGTLVASDKFGHFFDEGHTYYKMVVEEGKSLEEAMEKGVALEEGIYGYKRSKVFSYGDLSANHKGYEFWTSVIHDKNNNNYVACGKDGKFKLNRKFSFAEYVDDSWDESINCSKYANDFVTYRVNHRIAELESKFNRKLSCVSHIAKCEKLAEKYQDQKEYLINPACY